MIIFCSGMSRSASTWSYNVCRLLLESTGADIYTGYVGEAHDTDRFLNTHIPQSKKFTLIKCHDPGPHCRSLIKHNQAKNVYTYRDLRDSLASRMAFEAIAFDAALRGGLYQAQRMTEYAQHPSTLFVRYDRILHTPCDEIQAIAHYLGIPLSPNLREAIYQQTRLETVKQISSQVESLSSQHAFQARDHTVDRTTLLHANHISSAKIGRWRDELTPEQQLIVTLVFRPYLLAFDFETEESLEAIATSLMASLDWWAIAHRCLEKGHYQQGLSLFEYGLKLEPQNHRCGWYVGIVLVLMEQPQTAETLWLRQLMEIPAEQTNAALNQLLQELDRMGDRLHAKGNLAAAQRLKEHHEQLQSSVFSW